MELFIRSSPPLTQGTQIPVRRDLSSSRGSANSCRCRALDIGKFPARILLSALIVLLVFLRVWSQPLEFEGRAEILSALNSEYHEGNLVTTPSSERLFFTRIIPPGPGGESEGSTQLWFKERPFHQGPPVAAASVGVVDFTSLIGFLPPLGRRALVSSGMGAPGSAPRFWSMDYQGAATFNNAVRFPLPFFSKRSPHFCGSLSADGNTLLVSMEGAVTYGVEDIYCYLRREDGTWSSAINLGSRINTVFQETTPFLAQDNRTLFFSSNGAAGVGSFDVFFSSRIDDTWQHWTLPENLTAVNTRGSETNFILPPDGGHAYFISLADSETNGDIFRVPVRSAIVPASYPAPTIQQNTGQVSVPLRLTSSGQEIAGEVEVTGQGLFEVLRVPGTLSLSSPADLSIRFNIAGFLPETRQFTSSQVCCGDTLSIKLSPLTRGSTFKLENILFRKGSPEFVTGSLRGLSEVSQMLRQNPNLKIMLKGHTDPSGDEKQNLQLSRKRVEVIKSYLQAQGIGKDRVKGKGFGGKFPISKGEDEGSRGKNRRVEFTILSN